MIYELVFTDQAKTDLALLKRNEPAAFKKLLLFLLNCRNTRVQGQANQNLFPAVVQANGRVGSI